MSQYLPKIHKSIEDLPHRLIVSTTEKLSEFIETHLQPLVKQLPSYFRDTTDFLNKLQSYSRDWFETKHASSLYLDSI